ncbi:hypothetical protein BCR37DRAFT_193076 [Protomyces lactucae-debilis]|uniref:CASTOR ACT domain-containing protein n=1 Tax=Protomyces lactucae-debilis TaxID=2754530 RepID=A0A1Y2EU77_PROLT|nr:uncharacterized protein BCR37DRAFT_193076 [Protomyces lactucae-debilis]ORY75077.1 hypothetical protein BCR37DRAFT_193076 [Protomyces lactucae-debilis]
MTAICFLEPNLSLIHIPPAVFPHFLHGILSLCTQCPAFFNLSLTPTSISVICTEHEAERLFAPIVARLKASGASIEAQRYLAMQIDGDGISDGRKLLDLTQPLARAGVSILFMTTYFADYVLVAAQEASKVKRVLLETDFVFEDLTQSFVSHTPGLLSSFASPVITPKTRSRSTSRAADLANAGGSVNEELLKQSVEALVPHAGVNTLDFLRQCQVPVTLFKSIKLIMTGLRGPLSELLPTLTQVLLQETLPTFFSLTVAPETAPSLLLEPTLATLFGGPEKLLGAEADQVLVPISLDLQGLTTAGGSLGGYGIVCGVVEELLGRVSQSRIEKCLVAEELVMSYLSTVATGNVLLLEEDLEYIGRDSECRMM